MRLYDTNIIIEQLRNSDSQPGGISVLTLLELLRGVSEEKRQNLKENLEVLYRVQSLSNEIILEYCSLYTSLRNESETIPDADVIIAATALTGSDVLVSEDLHFERLLKYGLKLVKE